MPAAVVSCSPPYRGDSCKTCHLIRPSISLTKLGVCTTSLIPVFQTGSSWCWLLFSFTGGWHCGSFSTTGRQWQTPPPTPATLPAPDNTAFLITLVRQTRNNYQLWFLLPGFFWTWIPKEDRTGFCITARNLDRPENPSCPSQSWKPFLSWDNSGCRKVANGLAFR